MILQAYIRNRKLENIIIIFCFDYRKERPPARNFSEMEHNSKKGVHSFQKGNTILKKGIVFQKEHICTLFTKCILNWFV